MYNPEKRPSVPLRVGIVKAIDPSSGAVRVVFPDRDQLVSYWLPVVVPKTRTDKFYWLPDTDEQVVCLMDDHDEAGAVLGAIYSSVDTTPVASSDKWHLAAADGAVFEYDRSAHRLSIELPAGAALSIAAGQSSITVDTSGNVTISAASITLAGGGAAVARVGDTVSCPAGTGTIVSGSSKVTSG
jgi:phage baseplate assembly protein V